MNTLHFYYTMHYFMLKLLTNKLELLELYKDNIFNIVLDIMGKQKSLAYTRRYMDRTLTLLDTKLDDFMRVHKNQLTASELDHLKALDNFTKQFKRYVRGENAHAFPAILINLTTDQLKEKIVSLASRLDIKTEIIFLENYYYAVLYDLIHEKAIKFLLEKLYY